MAQEALKTDNNNVSEFKKKEADKLSKDVEQLRQDLTILKNDISSIAKTLSETSLKRLNETKDQVMNGSVEAYQSANKITKETLETTEKQIKARPFFAVAAAFGLGALISRLARTATK